MAIRVPPQADRQVVDALRDTDNVIEQLRRELADVRSRLAALERGESVGKPSTLTRLGDTQVEGTLYVTGPVSFRGAFTAPYQNLGYADMSPLTSVDPPGKTRVFEIHGSLAVLSAIECETLTVRNLIVTNSHTGP